MSARFSICSFKTFLIHGGQTNGEVGGSGLPVINLSGANLHGVVAEGSANLSYATLTGAFVCDADLSYANLEGAKGVDEELLWALQNQVPSLEGGAPMPNGQKYEDWLKSKSGGEDGENSGPS